MDIKWSTIRTDPYMIDYLCSAGSLARSGARRGRVNREPTSDTAAAEGVPENVPT